MAISPKTVAYQETVNNYSDTRQSIKGAQISSIKIYGTAPTTGGGDYQGQFAIANPTGTTLNLYVNTSTGWTLVGSSDPFNLPDTVVREDIDNNFTHPNQRILDCPIAYMDMDTRSIATVTPKGAGHVYIRDVDPKEVYFSADGLDWIQMRTHDDTGTYVVTTQANDFTHPDQTIESRPIVSMVQNSLDPVASNIPPTRTGELYVQLKDGTLDDKARMWIANPDGGLHWEPLTHLDLPTMLAYKNEENNFVLTKQTLNDKQILSFVDGGDKDPGTSGFAADYDGQFYLAVRTLVGGAKSVGVWVAHKNQWLPIMDDQDNATIARTNVSNQFTNPIQTLGTGLDQRTITGARVKTGGLSPVTDSLWRTNVVGEITVYHNDVAVPPQYSVWVSVLKNPSPTSNAGEWQMVWSSVNGTAEYLARTDRSNVFSADQFINDGAANHLITVAREGGTVEPDINVAPMSAGEVYSQNVGGGKKHNLWMSYAAGDSRSWRRLITDEDNSVAITAEPNEFATNEQFMRSHIPGKKDRIMGSRPAKIIGPNTITGPAYNAIEPTMFGEVVVCEEWDDTAPNDESKIRIVAYLAVGKGRKSWLKIGENLKSKLELLGDDSNN